MKRLALIFLLLTSLNLYAISGDKDDLVKAWEDIQKSSTEVESFEKIENNKYKIKFSVLPFEGELILLTADIEEMGNMGLKDNPFKKMGYLEIDLVGASDDLFKKYSRTYYKWSKNNSLYFNEETKSWMDSDEYTKLLESQDFYAGSTSGIMAIFEYWNIILFAILAYFVYSQIVNSKRVKESLALQKSSVENSLALQQKAIDNGAKMHSETNAILKQILDELKK